MDAALKAELIQDLGIIAVPALAVVAGFASLALARASAYLASKTKSVTFARAVAGAATVAGDISDKLAALPPGTSLDTARAAAVAQGVSDLKATVPVALKSLAMPDGVLSTIISGELGKLNATNPTMPPSVPPVAPVPAAPEKTI